jgi:hypothetical protein
VKKLGALRKPLALAGLGAHDSHPSVSKAPEGERQHREIAY